MILLFPVKGRSCTINVLLDIGISYNKTGESRRGRYSAKRLKNKNNYIIMTMKGGGTATIEVPIEQRNTGKGNPNAMLHFSRPLNKRQEKLLEALTAFDSRTVVKKRDVNLKDLSALTAETGVEYAMFTRKGERLVIRGNELMTNINEEMAVQLAEEGYKWSGHTHPGIDPNTITPSPGDYAILKAFGQSYSVILDATGRFGIFGGDWE